MKYANEQHDISYQSSNIHNFGHLVTLPPELGKILLLTFRGKYNNFSYFLFFLIW